MTCSENPRSHLLWDRLVFFQSTIDIPERHEYAIGDSEQLE